MKEGSDCSSVGGGCSDSARVIDPVSADSAADAASDLIVDIIVFLFWLWIIMSDVSKAVRRAITTEYCSYGGGIDKTRDFGAVHATPLMCR